MRALARRAPGEPRRTTAPPRRRAPPRALHGRPHGAAGGARTTTVALHPLSCVPIDRLWPLATPPEVIRHHLAPADAHQTRLLPRALTRGAVLRGHLIGRNERAQVLSVGVVGAC